MTTTRKTSAAQAETERETAETEAPKTTGRKGKPEPEGDGIERVTFEVEVRGTTLKLSTPADPDDWPAEAEVAFEQDQHITAFMAIIGPADRAKLRGAGATRRDLREVILPAWNEATGLGED
ncbi:MAG: hypothetical protein Q4F65_05895 [Propionibacteriaceae bacterium]|nr:hypothetical protein [Propionibacteriaceae bacterium]